MTPAGLEKSAILLLALGEDASAAVFRYLTPLEVGQLGAAMRELRVLPRSRVREVLAAYMAEAEQQTGFATDSARFLNDALTRALGAGEAASVLRRWNRAESASLKQLAWRTPTEIAAWLEAEPPQLIAVILLQLPQDSAAAVLELLPEALRGDTLMSLAHAEPPSAEVLHDIEAWAAERLQADQPAAASDASAASETVAAHLLAGMSRGSAEAVLHAVDRQDAPLAARLRAQALGFDDLLRVPVAGRQLFLRNIAARTLLLALKGSSRSLLDCVGEALSPAAAARLADDLDTLGAVPVTAIQAAQDEAAAILQGLAGDGAISVDARATLEAAVA
jgi:flagellar motor switch protein FliG